MTANGKTTALRISALLRNLARFSGPADPHGTVQLGSGQNDAPTLPHHDDPILGHPRRDVANVLHQRPPRGGIERARNFRRTDRGARSSGVEQLHDDASDALVAIRHAKWAAVSRSSPEGNMQCGNAVREATPSAAPPGAFASFRIADGAS